MLMKTCSDCCPQCAVKQQSVQKVTSASLLWSLRRCRDHSSRKSLMPRRPGPGISLRKWHLTAFSFASPGNLLCDCVYCQRGPLPLGVSYKPFHPVDFVKLVDLVCVTKNRAVNAFVCNSAQSTWQAPRKVYCLLYVGLLIFFFHQGFYLLAKYCCNMIFRVV